MTFEASATILCFSFITPIEGGAGLIYKILYSGEVTVEAVLNVSSWERNHFRGGDSNGALNDAETR